ncbi:MAG: CDP-glycerol glycerophosphotransferase family protein, partial [Demequina sp.]
TQVHHGTPLKLMGVEERGQDRAWMNGLLARSQHWDYSVVSSPYCAEVWQHSYPVKCETLEYGYPRNDVLANADAEVVASARDRVGITASGRIVLYMPTFRERSQDSISAEDINTVASALEPGDVLLTRGHYFAGRSLAGDMHPAVLDVTEHSSVEDLYLAADVLVTDYSSAMFDYANLGRPIVIFAYDWDHYRAQRGTYFDITVDAPGAVVSTAAELGSVLASREYANRENDKRLTRFAAIFCAFETGHAARDIVARVIDGTPARVPQRRAAPALTSWIMDRVA